MAEPTPARRDIKGYRYNERYQTTVGAHPVGDAVREAPQGYALDRAIRRSSARRARPAAARRKMSPTGWAPTTAAAWLSLHVTSSPERALGAHPRGEFRRRGRRAGN